MLYTPHHKLQKTETLTEITNQESIREAWLGREVGIYDCHHEQHFLSRLEECVEVAIGLLGLLLRARRRLALLIDSSLAVP